MILICCYTRRFVIILTPLLLLMILVDWTDSFCFGVRCNGCDQRAPLPWVPLPP